MGVYIITIACPFFSNLLLLIEIGNIFWETLEFIVTNNKDLFNNHKKYSNYKDSLKR